MKNESIDETLRQLESQNKELMTELSNLKSKPKGRIGYIFIFAGALLFALSIDFSNLIISFLSLALLFWGGLFLYIKPTNFIRQEILVSMLSDSLSLYDQIIKNSNYDGIPHYISPRTLSEYKDVYVYIPKNKEDSINFETITSKNGNSKYIQITPLGLGLSKLLEDEAKLNFSTINLEKLLALIEKILIEDLEVAKNFEYKIDDSEIQVKVVESIFNSIYKKASENKELINSDFLTSAIACSIAKSTHKPVKIGNINLEGEVTIAVLKTL